MDNEEAKALGRILRERREKLGYSLRTLERLSDGVLTRELLAESEELWPAHPEREPAMRAWLDRTREVLGRRADHARTLEALTTTGAGSALATPTSPSRPKRPRNGSHSATATPPKGFPLTGWRNSTPGYGDAFPIRTWLMTASVSNRNSFHHRRSQKSPTAAT